MTQQTVSLFDIGDDSLMGQSISTEYTRNVFEKFKKVFDTETEQGKTGDFVIKALALESTPQRQLWCSSIILTLGSKSNPSAGISYMVLLLESTSGKIPADIVRSTGNNQQIRIPVPSASAWDAVYMQAAANKVNTEFPNVETRCIGANVLPTDFPIENGDSFQTLLRHTTHLLVNDLRAHNPNYPKASLKMSSQNAGSFLKVVVDYSTKPLYDPLGNPIRSDITLRVVEVTPNKEKTGLNGGNGNGESVYANVSGFIDYVYSPAPQQTNSNWGMQQVENSQVEVPMFVITNMDLPRGQSLEIQLAVLTTLAGLGVGNEWANSARFFRDQAVDGNSSDKARAKLTDIGALNLDARIVAGGAIDTSVRYGTIVPHFDGTADDDQVQRFMQAVVRNQLFIAFDTVSGGAMSPVTDLWQALAIPGEKQGVSKNTIWEAAAVLTNGKSSEVIRNRFNGSAPEVLLGQALPIHIGYFYDTNKVKTDIRLIDRLAVMNEYGHQTPNIGDIWTGTFLGNGQRPDELLSQRAELIEGAVGAAPIRYTNWGLRLVINPQLISILSEAASLNNFNMQFTSPYQNRLNNGVRQLFNFAQVTQGLTGNDAGGLFRGPVAEQTGFNGVFNTGAQNRFFNGGI